MSYKFPDTYAEEKRSAEGPIRDTATGMGGFQAITQKGPVGIPIRATTFDAWKRIFGGREARGLAAYEAKQAFDEGLEELITVRQAHYADIADKDTYAGGVAARMIQSLTDLATSATKVTGSAPFEMSAGAEVDVDVDNAGVATATFDAAAGTVDDTTVYPVADQDAKNISITFDGGSAQSVIFSGATTTLASIIEQINAQIYGGRAVDNGGQLQLVSDTEGTGSSVVAGVGTSGLTFAASVAGTGDVANIRAVTIAELKTVMEADTTATVADNGDDTATISSPTDGVTSELDFQASSGLAALGLSVEVIAGTDAGGVADTLLLESGYMNQKSPGVAGNLLSVLVAQAPLRPSLGAGLDLAANADAADTSIQMATISGVGPNTVLKIWDGTNTEAHVVTGVRTVVSGGTVQFFADLEVALTNAFLASATMIQSSEFDLTLYEDDVTVETWTALSMYDAADNYVETLLNDEDIGSKFVVATDQDAGLGLDFPTTDTAAVDFTGGTSEILGLVDADWIGDETAKTGLFAWDDVNEFMPITTLDTNAALVVHAGNLYVESRIWMDFITYIDEDMSSVDAIAYRQNVLGLDSSYTFLYAGGTQVYDPDGVGSRPVKNLTGMGLVMAKMAVTDNLPDPNGGPWQTPAGEGAYGESRVSLDVATAYSNRESGEMNVNGINVITKFGNTDPVKVWGGRTLYAGSDLQWTYIATRRSFQFYEKSIVDSTRWAVFRNNDFILWRKIEDRVDRWLEDLMPRGAFPTDNKDEAFYIKTGIDTGVMDTGDKDQGYVISEIGIAPQKPGEFIVFRFTQFEGGTSVNEA